MTLSKPLTLSLLLLSSPSALALPIINNDFSAQLYYEDEYQGLNNTTDFSTYQPLSIDFDASSRHPLPAHLNPVPLKNWDYLMEQSYTIFGLSVATVGLMTFLPESVTNWTSEDRAFDNIATKWWNNVSSGPVWDEDDHYLNYVMHPYFGGVYYTAARHSGFNEWESFLYSFTMSTVFWEYGVEAFAEVPSTQDLIVTPLFGAAVGEWMFLSERLILDNGGYVLGSKALGDMTLFFLNPVGHIHYWVSNAWRGNSYVGLTYNPYFGDSDFATFATEAGDVPDKYFIAIEVKLGF